MNVNNITCGQKVSIKITSNSNGITTCPTGTGCIVETSSCSGRSGDILFLKITPGCRELSSAVNYTIAGSAPSLIYKKAAIAFLKNKHDNIMFALWNMNNQMDFTLAAGTLSVGWKWNSGITQAQIDDGMSRINKITDVTGYEVNFYGTGYDKDDKLWYMPVLLGIKDTQKPEPEADPCSIGPGLSSSSIAKCIQASSQKVLDGTERQWRQSTESVNSIRA